MTFLIDIMRQVDNIWLLSTYQAIIMETLNLWLEFINELLKLIS